MTTRTMAISVLLLCWLLVVVLSGLGWNPLEKQWDFTNSGAFGDSFGPLGAMMAGLAALAAFETLREQRMELARLKDRETQDDLRRAQDAFEVTFFKLFDSLRDIVKDTDIGTGDAKKSSRDAFQRLCTNLRGYKNRWDLQKSWDHLISFHRNDLGHYFRFLYNIVRYIDRHDNVDRQFYIRLLRSSLSEAELILLFANCAVGEGKDKFLPLVEKYSLLHNVSPEAHDFWEMQKHLSASAFGDK